MALVMFFYSSEFDLDSLGAELTRLFAGVQIVGCTTAGEFGPLSCHEHSISGASFSTSAFSGVTARIDNLKQFNSTVGVPLVLDLIHKLENAAPQANAGNSFAFLMIDGMSEREESVTHIVQTALGKLPLFGGSAGDDLKFGSTHVYFDGAFRSGSAVLTLVTTSEPFRIFKTQHFVATDKRAVVTSADTDHRIVREIDGRPAAEAYAELIGTTVADLDPTHFADAPMVVVIDGTNYVRSVRNLNADGSLTFFCAIEEGVVLRAARGVDLVENLTQAFAGIRDEIGQPQLVIGCDCILRKLEIVQRGLVKPVAALLHDNNAVGFNSYGEQYHGVHVNQTFTGIAIGATPTGSSDG
jgi:hypothetical protein